MADTGSKPSNLAIIFLGAASVVQATDPVVASIGIVKASSELGMSITVMALAASVSTLVIAATVLPFGFLGDRLGRRRVLIGTLLLCAIGGIIAAFAPSTPVYYLGRIVAGIGAGGSFTASYAYVRFVATPDKIPAALGLWKLINTVLFVLTSLAGGMLATTFDWRVAMLFAPAMAIVCAVLAPVILPAEPKRPGGRPDHLGMSTIGLGMIAFLYGISQASRGLHAPEFLIPMTVGVILFVCFYLIEHKVSNPAIPPQLFSSGIFNGAIVAGIAVNYATAAVQLQSSNFWQYVQKFSVDQVAIAQLTMVVPYAVCSLVAGRMMGAGRRPGRLMGGGFVALAGGVLALAFVSQGTPFWIFGLALFVFGIGHGFVAVPQSALFMQEAPAASFGPVLAFRTTIGQLGYTAGFAASASMLTAYGREDLIELLRNAGVPAYRLGEALDDVRMYMSTGEEGVGKLAQQVVSDFVPAYTEGFNWSMGISGVGTALLGLLTVILLILGMYQKKASHS